MSIEVNIPPFLQPLAGDAKLVNVSGRTTGECLKALVAQYPRLKPEIFNRKGNLLKGLSVFINGEVVYSKPLTRPVNDGDKLHITYIVMGG